MLGNALRQRVTRPRIYGSEPTLSKSGLCGNLKSRAERQKLVSTGELWYNTGGGEKMSGTFRCYVYRQGENYYAECLDLNLLTRRPTVLAAMESLNEAVLCHVEAAYSQGWEKDLIPRCAPLARWLRFYTSLVGHTVKALLTGHLDGLIAYEVRLRAVQPPELAYA